ncbi:MAG: tetratricopeptide repeat protein [Acidobacteria bacterium]|nr:tetratricopeptide repeat protein [Acidobacteriota bacterium]MCI0624590.1 tetratricopeptide repeat protein [Acidobacteriota bacterium]MCI0722832.1 tetratricopeptide repeat protein [Acidobacteriota bacterium]
MPQWKSSLLLLLILTLAAFFAPQAQTTRSDEERKPQIDAEDYHVEAELLAASHQIKAKASVRFKPLEDAVNSVVLEFNANLRPERAYFADKPPAPGAVAASEPEETPQSQSNVPYLSRRPQPQRKTAPKTPPPAPVKQPETNLLRFFRSEEDHTLRVDFNAPLARSQSATLVIEYGGTLNSADNSPLEGVQVAKIQDDVSYLFALSRWFPMHQYLKDRATATFRIAVPQGVVVAMDGTAKPKEQLGDKDVYTFVSERATFPGSLAAAKYNVLPMTAGKVEVTFYVKDNKRDFIGAQNETLAKILELYAERFGSFPGRSLKVAVIDNDSLLGYSAPGMEFLADRAFDKTPNVNLLAREIAYQWWQYLIVPRSPQDLWLKEGFANYSALLYQESISGEAGFAREMQETAVAALLHEDKSTIRNAYQLQVYSPEYNSILKSKGAYVLHMLRWVLGDENFFKVLKEYVYNFGYKEASIQDFKPIAEKVSAQNLTYFFSQWIDQNGVPDLKYDYTTYRAKEGFKVSGTIRQNIDTFRMPVEITIETDGKPETKRVEVIGPESAFSVSTFGKPKSAKIDPNYKVLRNSEQLRVAAAIAKGDELRRLGEPTEAIAEFQKAIELNKRSSLAFYRIGEAFFEQRSYNSAANSFREALNGDLEPKWLEVWCHINLGRIYDVLSQRERALGEYQKAVDTNDDSQGAQEIAQKHIKEPYKYEGNRQVVQ